MADRSPMGTGVKHLFPAARTDQVSRDALREALAAARDERRGQKR